MCYNQTGDISTLEGTPLKLVDIITYLGGSVESTEKDIETRLTKAWTAINRLSIIWKSDLTDKMKRSFFQAAVTSILLLGYIILLKSYDCLIFLEVLRTFYVRLQIREQKLKFYKTKDCYSDLQEKQNWLVLLPWYKSFLCLNIFFYKIELLFRVIFIKKNLC